MTVTIDVQHLEGRCKLTAKALTFNLTKPSLKVQSSDMQGDVSTKASKKRKISGYW